MEQDWSRIGAGLEQDWRRIGWLNEDWMRIGGGLEVYLCRFSIVGWMWMDRIWLGYTPGWPSYAPLWGLRADLLKKRPKFVKIVKIASKYTFWRLSYIFNTIPRMA